ncbi:MAG TPA: LysR family transcriptional regulator [Anaeromyxobacteraceae bacterium]|nr:LysR family transcriptional regulator [Anaeromyxobacteraceae bacterium]
MIRTLNSDQLLAFVAVARERGFSRAARGLLRTQSAVSQAVARLEEDLGVRLFSRRGRATEPTAAGRLLLEHSQRVLDEMQRARARLQALGALEEGSFVLGTSDTLAYYVLPPVIAAFRARYPGVELRLDNCPSPATAERVAERRVDLGLVSLPLPAGLRLGGKPLQERLRIESLAPQEEVVICPPRHPLARRRRVALGALMPYPLLLLDRGTAGRAYLEAELARLGLTPTVAMEMSSVEVLKRLVELGLGVSVVPAPAVAREEAAGLIAVLRLSGLHGARSLGLVMPAAGALPRAAQAFADLARSALGALSPRPPVRTEG